MISGKHDNNPKLLVVAIITNDLLWGVTQMSQIWRNVDFNFILFHLMFLDNHVSLLLLIIYNIGTYICEIFLL